MLRLPSLLTMLVPLTLAACGGSRSSPQPAGTYVGGPVRLECAPFARALSGVRLYGAAADWWRQADGRYARARTPDVGSVFVLARSARLPSGHVAVVSKVLSPRRILLTQANWVHGHVTADGPVLDISPAGDWSLVRMWWPPTNQMGVTEYQALGFIRADVPASHDQLEAATRGAIRVALSGS